MTCTQLSFTCWSAKKARQEVQSWRALLPIAFCCPMTQEKKVLWYCESSKHKTEPTQNCTTGDLAWSYQMRYELACNSIQETLFTEARSIRPHTHGGFQQYASRTLKALFGKSCTLTLLRHSYISHMLAYGQLSIKDEEELARDMCHSVETQAQYQFISNRWKGSESPTQKTESPTEGTSHRSGA